MNNIYVLLRTRASTTRHARSILALVVGALLLVSTSYIHWHLWDSLGYRHVPTIGWLFLAQCVTSLLLALGIVLVRELWLALLGAGFVASTLAGFLITVTHGLFGFQDSWLAPYARLAFGIEVAAFLLLLASALLIGVDARATHS